MQLKGLVMVHPILAALVAVTLAFGTAGFTAAAASSKSLPETSPEGLKLVPKTKVSAVYLREGATFGDYDKVMISDCYVAFRKNWQRDHNRDSAFRVSDADVTRIKTELADEFRKVFTAQLTAKGESVVSTPGSGVLVLRPAIINLDITAPDVAVAGRSRTFTASAGQATLFLELYDSVTSELLARAIDVKSARSTGGFISVTNGATNRTEAQRMLKKWADLLGTFLQNARTDVSPPAP
jgi:hypothetical protein